MIATRAINLNCRHLYRDNWQNYRATTCPLFSSWVSIWPLQFNRVCFHSRCSSKKREKYKSFKLNKYFQFQSFMLFFRQIIILAGLAVQQMDVFNLHNHAHFLLHTKYGFDRRQKCLSQMFLNTSKKLSKLTEEWKSQLGIFQNIFLFSFVYGGNIQIT